MNHLSSLGRERNDDMEEACSGVALGGGISGRVPLTANEPSREPLRKLSRDGCVTDALATTLFTRISPVERGGSAIPIAIASVRL